ncbi:hypothetical protein R1sor_014559 [Riccia sorocarpa]|uniref:START domain-containing protein n=1 Tax=Riccia sorocarpa TaxID=122646 RepID=A0ABD3HDK1_9MARC
MITGEEWAGATAGSATWVALAIVIICCLIRLLLRSRISFTVFAYRSNNSKAEQVTEVINKVTVTEDDLRKIIVSLQGKNEPGETSWEPAIERSNDSVSYTANRRDPKDGGPTQYLSWTVFENVSTETVRDFYMDNDFRCEWDKTVTQHEQLEIDPTTGVEIGRTIKKFPLFSPREYVLSWRVWEGKDKSFYCVIKACEHESVPRHPKFKRVDVYSSGWRIRKVPGRDACEIVLVHQEDLGMRKDMAKVGFTRGIWSYVTKMDFHLRRYALRPPRLHLSKNAVSLSQKVPASLEETVEGAAASEMVCLGSSKLKRRSRSKKQLAKGLLLLGGAMWIMRGSSSVGARLAAACIVNRVVRPQRSLTSVFRRTSSKAL